jgi:release factor glutamine methyltransferase
VAERVSSPTIHDRIREAQTRLRAAHIADPEAAIDAELLARHVLGWTREQMLVNWLEPATADFDRRYQALVVRRTAREPVAYVIGHREFWGLEFEVTRDVLIPRPETELIVEEALALERNGLFQAPRPDIAHGSMPTIVDVGTGSGCLAVALAHELPHAKVVAIDVSIAALHVAQRNADRHGVAGRIAWHAGSLLEPIDRAVDLIVSNPPYVPLRDAETLPSDVRDYEPPIALFSGEDGLATIRALVAQACDRVRAGGALIFEFGFGQAHAVREIIASASVWRLVHLREDLQGVPRTAVLRRI